MAKKARGMVRPARPVKKVAKKPSRKKVEAIPRQYGSVTAGLAIRGAADAIAFYAKAFGAKETMRMPGPGGKVMHAELKFGDRIVMLSDEFPDMGAPSPQTLGGTTVGLLLYVKDVDASYARAVAAGAKPVSPPTDMFWGDRFGQVLDPFGHRWSIATHTADLTPAQMEKGMQEWMAAQGKPQG